MPSIELTEHALLKNFIALTELNSVHMGKISSPITEFPVEKTEISATEPDHPLI